MTSKDRESPIAFHGTALLFGNAAYLLEMETIAVRPGRGFVGQRLACEFGATVLRALSVELALKFLAYLRSGKSPGGHDLWDLYSGLDHETQEVIEAVDLRTPSEYAFVPVGTILKANRSAFVSVRYLSLKSPPFSLPDWRALGRAHNVLVEVGTDPDFRALCPSGVTHV